MAYKHESGTEHCTARCPFRRNRTTEIILQEESITIRTAVYGAVCTVVWEGGCTSFRLMCAGFASLMPLSNNCSYKPAAFRSLHVGQD